MDNMMSNNAPMMPDHELPPHHAPMSLKIVLLLFALVVVGALSYLVLSDRGTSDDAEEAAAVVVKKKTTATATSTATTDTSTWKSYTTTYGYSLKHPASLAPAKSDDGTGNLSLSDGGVGQWMYSINIKKNTNNLSLMAALDQEFTSFQKTEKDATVTSISVGGKSAKQYTIAPATDSTGIFGVVLLNGNDIIAMSSLDGGKEFSALLSTLTFTK